jgi:TolB-like protein
MITTRIAVVLAVLVCTSPAQERAVVFDFQPLGVDTATAQLAAMLLRERLSDVNAFTLVTPPAPPTYASEEQLQAARDLAAQKAIGGSLARIGTKVIVSYRLLDAAAGSVVLSDRATIGTVEELDLAMERIALALKERKPFGGTGEVGRLTDVERQRKAAASSVFLTTGYTFPLQHQIPADPGMMLFTLDAAVTYETPDVLAQGLMGYRRGENSFNEIYFDLLIHRMFSRFDVTPYVGGGIGVHRLSSRKWVPHQGYQGGYYAEAEDDGLALVASGGLILFRTQFFRLMGNVKGSVVFTEDFGVNYFGSFGFGLSSPTFGPGGGVNAPSPCIFGCLGAFFLTGLIVAMTT